MSFEEPDKGDLPAFHEAYRLIWDCMAGKMPLFEFEIAVIYILFGCGICIHVFR